MSAAAELIDVSSETLRRWADDRLIRHIRLPSGQLRFRRAYIEEFLQPIEPTAAARRGRQEAKAS